MLSVQGMTAEEERRALKQHIKGAQANYRDMHGREMSRRDMSAEFRTTFARYKYLEEQRQR